MPSLLQMAHGGSESLNLDRNDLFVTGNFGSKAPYNFSQMQEFLLSMASPVCMGILGWLDFLTFGKDHHHSVI